MARLVAADQEEGPVQRAVKIDTGMSRLSTAPGHQREGRKDGAARSATLNHDRASILQDGQFDVQEKD